MALTNDRKFFCFSLRFLSQITHSASQGEEILSKINAIPRRRHHYVDVLEEFCNFNRLRISNKDHVIVPHIHETINLADVASAQRRMKKGKVHGKVCVRVDA